MIKNMVFDMAWVLFEFTPTEFINRYIADKDDAELVNSKLFFAPEWVNTDRGTLSDEDYLKIVLSRLPERLHEITGFLYQHWDEMPTPFPEMEKLVQTLKQNGYGIYLLSNMSARFYRFYKKIPAMRFFDGMIVSADVHTIKPEPEIYRILFDRFRLKPEECFFIDDRAENIEEGKTFGMSGFCYQQNMEDLHSALADAGVRV